MEVSYGKITNVAQDYKGKFTAHVTDIVSKEKYLEFLIYENDNDSNTYTHM